MTGDTTDTEIHEKKMSRRKLLGYAGATAVTGILLGSRSAWGEERSTGQSVHEQLKLFEDQVNGKIEDTRSYVDQEVTRVQTMKKPFTNTDGAVTKVLNTGLTYMHRKDLVYGNRLTPFSPAVYPTADGRFELDCSSFVQCCITGTTYENSRYHNHRNFFDESHYPLVTDTIHGRMLANQIGKYCYDNGMAFRPRWDWSNVRVGDLIFLYNSPESRFWNRIGHVMIVSRIDQNGKISVFESISKRPSAVVENTYTHGELNGAKKAHLCGRIPLSDTAEDIRCISYDTYDVAKSRRAVYTTKPLKPNKMYTLFFRGDFPGSSYPVIRTGDGSGYTVYSFTSAVRKRPDRMYKVNFFIPEDKLGYTHQIDIVTENGSGESIIDFAALYDGYVTACPHDVDPMLRPSRQLTFKKSVTLAAGEKGLLSFAGEISRVWDDRYYAHMDVTVIGEDSLGVMATLTHRSRQYVSVMNLNDKPVAVEIHFNLTQVLK